MSIRGVREVAGKDAGQVIHRESSCHLVYRLIRNGLLLSRAAGEEINLKVTKLNPRKM